MALDNAIVIILVALTISGLLWIQYRSKKSYKEGASEDRQDNGKKDK